MTDINILFCRRLLVLTHEDVKKFYPAINLKTAAWVWCGTRDYWEFHGPDKYIWYGVADNAYDARAKGWGAWLRSKGVE
jgi:hypothetical protein